MQIWQVFDVEALQYDWVLGTLIKKKKRRDENTANFNFSMHSKHDSFHNHCKNIIPKVDSISE